MTSGIHGGQASNSSLTSSGMPRLSAAGAQSTWRPPLLAVLLVTGAMTVAYTANDLQRASRGRFVLGLGSQVRAHVTRRFSMPWGRPAEQMRDYVLALRAIWRSWSSGEPLAFETDHYRHTLMTPMFEPALRLRVKDQGLSPHASG